MATVFVVMKVMATVLVVMKVTVPLRRGLLLKKERLQQPNWLKFFGDQQEPSKPHKKAMMFTIRQSQHAGYLRKLTLFYKRQIV